MVRYRDGRAIPIECSLGFAQLKSRKARNSKMAEISDIFHFRATASPFPPSWSIGIWSIFSPCCEEQVLSWFWNYCPSIGLADSSKPANWRLVSGWTFPWIDSRLGELGINKGLATHRSGNSGYHSCVCQTAAIGTRAGSSWTRTSLQQRPT